MAERKLTTWQVLRNRFPEQECVLIEEVSDASGFSRSRSLDYMVINLWESRGLSITGIEKKSNRNDWIRELKNPAKQERHFKYCDYFYLLTDKENVAKLEEIPETWGWYHINEKGVLKTMKPAPKLSPEPVNRSLLCAMLRRAADKKGFIRKESIEAEIESRIESAKIAFDREVTYEKKRYGEMKQLVDDFESATGLRLELSWWRKTNDPKVVGEAVKALISGDAKQRVDAINMAFQSIEKIYNNMKSDIENLNLIPKDLIVFSDDDNKEQLAKVDSNLLGEEG